MTVLNRFVQSIGDKLDRKTTLAAWVQNRDNNLDTLRLLGALLVIFSHSFGIVGVPGKNPPFYTEQYGLIGVNIFFVISGFLITKSYLRLKNAVRFVWARFLRIFPALILVTITLVFVLGPLLTTLAKGEYFTHPWTRSYLRGALSLYEVTIYTSLPGVFMDNPYVQVNGPLWTLQYEWTFYFVVLLLGVTALLERKGLVAFLFTISFVLTYFNVFSVGDTTTNYARLLHYVPIFFMYFSFGALAYLYRNKIPMTWGALLLVLAVLGVGSLRGGFGDSLFVFLLGYLVLFIGFCPRIRLSCLTRSGDYSYGLYVWGWPVQQTVFHFLRREVNVWMQLGLSVCIALVLAALSWHLVEKKMLRLKDHLPISWRKPGRFSKKNKVYPANAES